MKAPNTGILKRIAKLIDVKSIVTLTLTFVFGKLILDGADIPQGFLEIYLILIGFYFGTQSQKKANNNEGERVMGEEDEVMKEVEVSEEIYEEVGEVDE